MFEFDYDRAGILVLQVVYTSFAIFGFLDLMITIFLKSTKKQREELKRKIEEARWQKLILKTIGQTTDKTLTREFKRLVDTGEIRVQEIKKELNQPVWIDDGEDK